MAEDRINSTTSDDQSESGNEARDERGGKVGEPQEKARPDTGGSREEAEKNSRSVEQDQKAGPDSGRANEETQKASKEDNKK